MGAADNRIDLTPGMYIDDAAGVANQTTTPGMGVKRNAVGGFDLRVAADVGLPVAIVATAPERGKSIGDNYVQNETLRVCYPDRAELLNVLLAAGENVAVGAALEADDGGFFRARTTNPTLFITEEAVNASGGAALCRVRGAAPTIA